MVALAALSNSNVGVLGPVVQSIVSGQLVKCFTTLLLNTLIFFVENMRETFCTAKASHIFSAKILAHFRY